MKATQRILQYIVVLLVILTVFQACKKQKNTDLSGSYSVSAAQSINLPSGGNEATLTLVKIADSRCPINALCTTAGSAVATLQFHDAQQDQTVMLTIGDGVNNQNTSQLIT